MEQLKIAEGAMQASGADLEQAQMQRIAAARVLMQLVEVGNPNWRTTLRQTGSDRLEAGVYDKNAEAKHAH
jgi:hypothetical protein